MCVASSFSNYFYMGGVGFNSETFTLPLYTKKQSISVCTADVQLMGSTTEKKWTECVKRCKLQLNIQTAADVITSANTKILKIKLELGLILIKNKLFPSGF